MTGTGRDIAPGAWALIGLLSLVWGTSFAAVAVALTGMGPLTAVLHRVFWAALILVALAGALGQRLPADPRVWGALAVMGLLNNALPFSLIAWAQTRVESGLAGILNASTALFALPVAAAFFAEERLTARRVLGVLTGLAGVVLAIGPGSLAGLDPRALGQVAVLGGALSYACAAAWARARLGGLHPVAAAAGMTLTAALMIAPVALAAEGLPRPDLPARVWAAVAWYAGAGTALAYLLYYRILALAGPANLMLVTLAIPVVAVALGTLLMGEHLPARALAGFGLVALGLAIIDGRLARAIGLRAGRAP
ncbi:MAG: multidrug transporter [Paracoccaceae bacterium]|nr:MAG: multidrug transporter [Paracoccaceae bacterium]